MPRKATPPPYVRPELLIPLSQARERVYKQLEKGDEISKLEIHNEGDLQDAEARQRAWSEYTEEMLKQIFNTQEIARKFTGVGGVMFFGAQQPPLHTRIESFRKDIQKELQRLASVYEQLELFPMSPTGGAPRQDTTRVASDPPRTTSVTINNYGTINNPQIQQGVTNSSQRIAATGDFRDIQSLMQQLTQAVDQLAASLPDEVARQVRQDLSVLHAEASSPTPRTAWWQLSADGLKKAAQDVGEIGKPVLELLSRILPLLMALNQGN